MPATGKTWLGCWLADRGYLHIDAERAGGADFDRVSIHSQWDDLIATGRAAVFAAAVEGLGHPVVVNWGFPLTYLYIVPALQAAGFQTWWLHASREPARKAFVAREQAKPVFERIAAACFDRQASDIDRQWLLINAVFKNRMITAFHQDGSQRNPEELWSEMNQAG
jgi:hypothetical protein